MNSAPYDGFVKAGSLSNDSALGLYINEQEIGFMSIGGGVKSLGEFAFRKGDKIRIDGGFDGRTWICFFKKRDYSNR